jgi:hypothetical protein
MRNRLTVLYILTLSVAMIGLTSRVNAQSSPAPAGQSSPQPAGPLATADGEAPGTQLQVTKFKRAGDSVILQFVLINNSDSSYDPNNLQSSNYRSVDGVYLVDLAGKKKYEVVRDSTGVGVCSQGVQEIPSKSSANVWAKFPAPPDNVQKLGIVVPHFMPMDDVPLSQ